MDFNVLPKQINGKGVTITINAPILTDADAIAAACQEGLAKVAETIIGDVTQAEVGLFADRPGSSKFPDEYPNQTTYYSSGMIPYWRGGLLGSFEDLGEATETSRNLAFTASYAGVIEEGGAIETVPLEWAQDKIDPDYKGDFVVYSSKPHPFVENVAYKLDNNMELFGYLDLFGEHFVSHFNRYL